MPQLLYFSLGYAVISLLGSPYCEQYSPFFSLFERLIIVLRSSFHGL